MGKSKQRKHSSEMSDRSFEAKKRAFHAVARMRHDRMSPSDAASEEGTTIATIKKYLPATLRKSRTGRWVVTKSDSYLRLLSLPGPHGPVTVRVHGSKEAQFASAYVASVKRWRKTRKSYELAPFHGKNVGDFQLITASRTLTEHVICFDTETTLDPQDQALLFGFYRVCRLEGNNYHCVEEGILHADDRRKTQPKPSRWSS